MHGWRTLRRKVGLDILKWNASQCRRVHRDLIIVYKIVYGSVDVASDEFFEYAEYGTTRGHWFKLKIKRSNLFVRRNFFIFQSCLHGTH